MAEPSRKWVNELLRLLPEWVEDGIISPDAAERLQRRYGPVVGGGLSIFRNFQIALSILCGLLLSGGLILLISHNWDEFSPSCRLAIAYLPLLAGIGFGFFTLLRHGDDSRFTEPAALWIAAASASALAIISQLYHISGGLHEYLLALLLLLILPLYVFRSAALAALYTIGCIVCCSTYSWWRPRGGMLDEALLLVLPVIPLLAGMMLRRGPQIRRFIARYSCAVLVILLCCIIDYRDLTRKWDLLFWALVSALFCFAGGELERRERGRFGNLFGNLGWYGMLGALCGFSSWEFRPLSQPVGPLEWDGAFWLLLFIAGWGVAVWFSLWRRRAWARIWYLAFPPVMACAFLTTESGPLLILFNLYLAAVGIMFLATGVRSRNLRRLNGGLLLLALQIFLRFVEEGDILLYAAIFLTLGVLLLLVNILIPRSFREEVRQ